MKKTLTTLTVVAAIVLTSLLGFGVSPSHAAPSAKVDVAETVETSRFRPDLPIGTAVNQAPAFNDYIQCVGSYMYADFVDPDGADEDMTVLVYGYQYGQGFVVRQMDTSTAHGVFFSIDRAAHGLIGSSFYYLRAIDADGASSPTIFVSADCNGNQFG